MKKQTLKDREELKYKKRFEDLQDRLKSPLDELFTGRLVLEFEKNDKIKKMQKELSELRKFKDNFGKNDFERSIKVILGMFGNIIRQNNKLELTEKERLRLLKEKIKLSIECNKLKKQIKHDAPVSLNETEDKNGS